MTTIIAPAPTARNSGVNDVERLLRGALAAPLTPRSYVFYAAIVLSEPGVGPWTSWVSCTSLAELAGTTHYAARTLVAHLVDAGLLERRRRRGRRGPGLPATTLIDYRLRDDR